MQSTILNYIKEIFSDKLTVKRIVPEFYEPIIYALGLENDYNAGKITWENLPQFIDTVKTDDMQIVINLLSNKNFNTEFIDAEFLAAIIKSPAFANIYKNETLKKIIFSLYVQTLKNLKTADADYVVMQKEVLQALINKCSDEGQKRLFAEIIEDKIKEVKDFAEEIKSKDDLLKFTAVKYDENDFLKNKDAVMKNLLKVFGKDNGVILQMAFEQILKNGDREQESLLIDGMVMNFDAKMLALRKAWGIDEGEAMQNFIVRGGTK